MNKSKTLLSLLESSEQFFFSFDLKTESLTYINAAFEFFFKRKINELNPNFLFKIVHPEDQPYLKQKFEACCRGHSVRNIEIRILWNEKTHWFRIHPFLVIEKDEHFLMGHADDITLYKEHSENLMRHNDKKNSILNIVSHDLVGPLSFIRNIATILSRELKSLNDFKFDKFISIIYKTSEECIALIRDFLNVEFLESSEVRLLKKRVDLAERIRNIIVQYQEMQGELKKQFHFKANKKSIYAEIDDEKFMQVINNLISNALKFTHDNGVINILMNETQTEVQITVTDNGIGIPVQYQRVLFDKFSAARRRGLKDEHSTGLGMYIIKTIIDWHQGAISFESKEGQGTSFYITLPK